MQRCYSRYKTSSEVEHSEKGRHIRTWKNRFICRSHRFSLLTSQWRFHPFQEKAIRADRCNLKIGKSYYKRWIVICHGISPKLEGYYQIQILIIQQQQEIPERRLLNLSRLERRIGAHKYRIARFVWCRHIICHKMFVGIMCRILAKPAAQRRISIRRSPLFCCS